MIMAIAGLHNISVLESSFLGGSQSSSSRRLENEGRVHSRASSILQMWRELEDEHVMSRPRDRVGERLLQQRSGGGLTVDISRDATEGHGSDNTGDLDDVSVSDSECRTWSDGLGLNGSSPEHELCSNFSSEHSSDFGEGGRGRVRQIFQEWMSSGGVGECTSNASHLNNSSRGEWLGETEQERVRIIREWVRLNSQQRGASGDNVEEQPTELGNEIERVRDGLVLNQSEGQSQHNRRGIRRLCGRQALLDMVKKAERERQMELEVLLDRRPVSHFAHRNRIQSLLRGRFLRNGRVVENERSMSIAESELGLLRQRHTVSGLRDGFDSRLDASGGGEVGSSQSVTSSSNSIVTKNENTLANNLHEVIDGSFKQSVVNVEGSNYRDYDNLGTPDFSGNTTQDIISHVSNAPIENCPEEVLDNIARGQPCSSDIEFVESRDDTSQNIIDNLRITTFEQTQEISGHESNDEHSNTEGEGEVSRQQSELNGDLSVTSELSDNADNLQRSMLGNVISPEFDSQPYQWQDRVSETEERDHGINLIVESTVEDQQDTAAYEWFQEMVGNEDGEDNQLEEVPEVWHDEGGFQEAVQNWLEEPSSHDSDSVRRVDTFYFPDDDNAHNTELRELLSRRRVSNLLSSGFRQNLDQLIQSYVERQGHAAVDWEDASPSPEYTEDMEHAYANEGEVNIVESPNLALPSVPITSSPLWDQGSHHDNWPHHDMHQRFGIEWETVNDMRIDMARLQQKMNNLQRMMEACMDMQLELQRSIRQEVSDALNRSAGSQGVCEDGLLEDGSKWDNVRKGICCMCCNRSIDSLLYRCGHMCTCLKCATDLVESSGKCPMCRAPAVEVIRTYSVL